MKKRFSVAEFAQFARTTRDTLLYYDKIGLLQPESREKNNYRIYSTGQLAIVNFIRTCQSLGMTLADIRRMEATRTPELMDELLSQQIERINGAMEEWDRARKLLTVLKKNIHSVLHVDEKAITVQRMPEEAVVFGGLNDYSGGQTDYDALFVFYRSCKEKYPDMDLNYPVWGEFSLERIRRRDWHWPDRYYFYNPEGHDRKPAALYAIGYMRGGYGHCGDLFERMLAHIGTSDFELCGPAYVEYPLNEFCVTEEKNFLMRMMITVRER